MPKFKESLIDPATGLNSLDINNSCSVLSIMDFSNYDTNDDPGHARADFTDYRKITISRPKAGDYVMFTIDGEGVDEVIAPPSSLTDSFSYIIQDTDVDGVYYVTICSYPTYDAGAIYVSTTLQVVFYNGLLYKSIQTSSGQTPDVSPLYWELYAPTHEEELLTKYCTKQAIAILCISINACFQDLIKSAFCETKLNYCNKDILCKNPIMLDTLMLLVTLEAINNSAAKSAWDEVEDQFNILRLICNCR